MKDRDARTKVNSVLILVDKNEFEYLLVPKFENYVFAN